MSKFSLLRLFVKKLKKEFEICICLHLFIIFSYFFNKKVRKQKNLKKVEKQNSIFFVRFLSKTRWNFTELRNAHALSSVWSLQSTLALISRLFTANVLAQQWKTPSLPNHLSENPQFWLLLREPSMVQTLLSSMWSFLRSFSINQNVQEVEPNWVWSLWTLSVSFFFFHLRFILAQSGKCATCTPFIHAQVDQWLEFAENEISPAVRPIILPIVGVLLVGHTYM